LTQLNFYRARSSFAIAKAATCGAFRRIPEAFASLGERAAGAANFALEEAGFLVEALREPSVPDHAIDSEDGRRWQRVPHFLDGSFSLCSILTPWIFQ
jgi:hypothetical protein